MGSSEVVSVNQSRRVSSVIAELIAEIEQFIQTHTELFKEEIKQKVPHLLNAARLTAAGGLFLVTGYLFLAIAVVVLIASAFPRNLYSWFFGFLIVGIVSVGFGAVTVFAAKSEFILKSMLPERSVNGLKPAGDEVQRQKHL